MDNEITELLQRIEKEVMQVIDKNIQQSNLDLLTVCSTVFITCLGKVVSYVKETQGIKRAKTLRELFSQRIHAYPLDEKEQAHVQ